MRLCNIPMNPTLLEINWQSTFNILPFCTLLEKTNPSSVPPENHLTQQNPPSPHPCDKKMIRPLTL